MEQRCVSQKGGEALQLNQNALYSFRKETLEIAPQFLGSGEDDQDAEDGMKLS